MATMLDFSMVECGQYDRWSDIRHPAHNDGFARAQVARTNGHSLIVLELDMCSNVRSLVIFVASCAW